MAKGDVVNDLDSIASSSVDFQPSAGVEVLVKSWTGDLNSSVNISLYNGTDVSIYQTGDQVPAAPVIALLLNNTNYLRRTTSVTEVLGFCGVQTK